jgi:stage II sporulation protein D
MSQNGANELAKLGYTAAQIISHYYNGAVLSSVEK